MCDNKSFGKTRVGTNLIGKLLKQYPNFRIIVVVPTTTLKEQWEEILDNLGYGLNCEVFVINTAIKQERRCDLLIIDEIHVAGATLFSKIFTQIKYKLILGLTATIERLDGKEEIIKKYCPICDSISLEVALFNGWVSPYKEYQVIINVDDIQDYENMQCSFQESFEFFNYDYDLIMKKFKGKNGFIEKCKYRDELCPFNGTNQEERKALLQSINYHAANFTNKMMARKKFINEHPKKLEIARKIIEARPDAKIITFSNSIKMAESIGIGKVYSSKETKKKGRLTLEELVRGEFKVLNTVRKADTGLDISDLSVAIQIGIDSSKIKAIQKTGRVIRFVQGKQAEIFTIVINNTQETKWYETSHSNSKYITIDEKGLEDVLAGKEPQPYVRPIKQWTFRF